MPCIKLGAPAKIPKKNTSMCPVFYWSGQWKATGSCRFWWRKAKERITDSVQVKQDFSKSRKAKLYHKITEW